MSADCGWLAASLPVAATLDAARVYRLTAARWALDVAAFAIDKIAAPARLAFTARSCPCRSGPIAGIEGE